MIWDLEEMAQCIEGLLHKHEDLSSNPPHPCEKEMVAGTCNTSAVRGRDR